MNERVFCLDCQQALTPTAENGEGWLFHFIAGHRVIAVDACDIPVCAVVISEAA